MKNLIIAFGIFLMACNGKGDKVASDVGNCALSELPGGVAELVPEVEAALLGSAADWSAEIVNLEKRGMAFAICAVEVAVADLKAKASVAEKSAGADYGVAFARADAYLKAHKK